jgi:2-polyprenyl-3-methyl-5-hydroxy-6-metoxy-1,4-benzoquinol methylase
VSEEDRLRWNKRYAQGAYQQRDHPSDLLVAACADISPHAGPALDLACGAGRNARYLAGLGFDVTGLDISTVALQRAQDAAAASNLQVAWQACDLERITSLDQNYQLICMMRYVNAQLLSVAAGSLAIGGTLVVEEHLRTKSAVAGPRNPDFRVPEGALLQAAEGLTVLYHQEGEFTDPDGAVVALARLIARREE